MALFTELELYLPLDEASGDALDLGPNNLDFTETGGTIAQAASGVGNFRDFEAGDTEYFEHADHANLRAGDTDFHISVWVKAETLASNPVIFGKGWQATNDADKEFALYYDTTASRFVFAKVASTTLVSVTANNFGAASTGVVYNIQCWHDSVNNLIGISINDTTPNTTSTSTGVNAGTRSFQVGASSSQSLYWDGLIGRLYFWRATATAGDRTAIYNGGTPYVFAIDSVVDQVTASGDWTCPASVTAVDVAITAPGGTGGDGGVNGGGGGGGGAFSKSTDVAVTPFNAYAIVCAAGNDASFAGDSENVIAKKGANASGSSPGAGGAAASGTGDTKFSGGTGGAGGMTQFGGGGSSAGPTANGNNGGLGTGGAAVSGGGKGGATNAANGDAPGGGGAGKISGTPGGSGGAGRVLITYTPDPASTYTASVAATIGAVTAATNVAYSPGTKTASVAATIGPATAAASATFDPPVYASSVAAVIGAATAASTAEYTNASEFTASVAALLGAVTAAATATHTTPNYTAAVAATIAPVTAQASLQFTNQKRLLMLRRRLAI